MDISSLISNLKNIGDQIGALFSKFIAFLAGSSPAKITGIIVLLLVGLGVWKLVSAGTKWLIIILIALAVISLGVSLF